MEMSTSQLWTGFLAFCGARAPSQELMLEYAQELAARGNAHTVDVRYETIVAILRTRLACNRPAAQSAAGVRREREAGYGASRRMLS